MTRHARIRHSCISPLLALAGLGALAPPALAAAPAFQQAPARVVLAVDTALQSVSVPTSEAALPNGGVVIGGFGTPGALNSSGFPAIAAYAAELRPDGRLDASFGHGGIAKIPGLVGGPSEIIRQPHGKLLMVGEGVGNPLRSPLAVIARLDADGTTDQSFGAGGFETLGIQSGEAALLPSGEIVATGGAGTTGLVSALHPTQLGDSRWDVVELTSTGGLDPAFGSGGIVTLPPAAGSGQSLEIAADGGILTTGLNELTPAKIVDQLTRLTPSGTIDPTFNGGQPVTLPGDNDRGLIAVNQNGSMLVKIANGANAGVLRYTATGAVDPTFGGSGMLALPAGGGLQTIAGGGLLETVGVDQVPGLQVVRLTANGVVDPTLGGPTGLHVGLSFGGADHLPLFGTVHPQPIAGLDENSFSGGLLQRPDGSYLAVGEVSVFEQTGSGDGPTINRFAVEALTAAFKPDRSFGGPAAALRVRLTLPVQSTATAVHRHAIRVTLTSSQPGDARIVVKAAGRIVAQSLLPVLRVGANTLPVVLTTSAVKWLRGHPRSRLAMTTEARDLLTNTATAAGSGRLR